MTKSILDTGPLPEPSGPQEARDYLKAAAFESPDLENVTLTSAEFTSLCPRTGQPDFGAVTIRYQPDRLCIESRALKYYLWSYRAEPAFCETLAARIADDVLYAVNPLEVEVVVEQASRGGVRIAARATRKR